MTMENDYAIINLNNMDFMKNDDGKIMLYKSASDASEVCGMYEWDDVWVVKLIYNHKEKNIW